MLESNNDKRVQIPRSCEQLPFQSAGSLTLIFHITTGSWPSFLFSWLHFLPFLLLYCLSCVSSFTSLSVRHTSNSLPFSWHLSVSLSHLSWFPCVGSDIILTCSSASQRLSCQYSQDVQLLFCTLLAGKGYLWADNLSYIPCLLTAEKPLYEEQAGSL